MPSRKKFRIAGINFDFRHMDHLLGCAHRAPNAEIVGISHHDPREMQDVIRTCRIPADRVFTDWRVCLEQSKPDVVILCPATGAHAEWVARIAPHGVHVLIEKPFAGNLAQADRMIAAVKKSRCLLAINWPLRWYPSHVTAKRLIDEGRIGEVIEVHFYDGNRGPLWHAADKVETTPTTEAKAASWFYKKSAGGGALLDYLGYGTTLGT